MLNLKLMAKRRMMRDNLRCFFISILPFLTLCSLVIINYYLPFFLKKTMVGTDNFLFVFLIILSAVISLCLWKSVCLIKEAFFLMKSKYKKVKFFKIVRKITIKQYFTFIKASVLKTLLSVSWSTLYFAPSLVVALLLIYSYRNENYSENVYITLFASSIVLFVIGLLHLFVTLKRYSLCGAIILRDKEKNALNVIAESINLMENHCVEYSIYCASFSGWILSCIFVIPIFYVLPFVNMSKWCYLTHLNKAETTVKENEKPIIFYIQKQIKNGG